MYKDSTEPRPASVAGPAFVELRSLPVNALSVKPVGEVDTLYTVQIPRREPGSPAPLSLMQQQMWLLSQLIPHLPVYNETLMLHLPFQLDVPSFERSLDEIIQRHALWRTSFPLVHGQPVQMIHPAWQVALSIVEVPTLLASEREEKLLQLATGLALPPFDLTTLPLLRAQLFRLAEDNYYFCLVMHQSIFDVQSLYQVFLPELHALYQSFIHGKPSPLPPVSFEYADFAVWQQGQQRGNELAKQLAYWKQQLANAPAVLELPADHPAPSTPSYRGSRLPFTLSEELTAGLKRLSQREEAPLDVVLIATLLVLLQRYTGQSDLMLGQTNQNNSGSNGPLGVFLTTLLLRTDVGDNPTFQALLERVKAVSLAAKANQDVPFHTLVQALDAEHNGRQFPVQVVFALEPALPVLPSGWAVSWPNVAVNVATSDLFFIMRDQPDGLTGWFGYNTDIFDASTVQRMFQHWEVLVAGIVHNHLSRLSELPILTGEEYQQLVVDWNNTRRPYPDDQCIHQLFEAQAGRTPDACALIFAGQRMTYGELDTKANQLAHYLRRSGVGPEVRVGICMDRSLEMLVAVLGVLKAGGAYLPLDPQYPEERLLFLLQDAQPLLILTHKQAFTPLSDYPARVINLESDWQVIAQESQAQVVNQSDPTNLAYIIYTSGSTGKPKGVLVTQQNLVNSTCARIAYHTTIESLLVLTPFVFDATVGSIFGTLCQGGTLVLPPSGAELEIAALADLIAEYQVSHFVWAPVLYALLLENATTSQLSSLCAVTVGGEACPKALVERHYELLPHVSLFNDYGPTEGTVWSSVHQCRPHSPGNVVPIGRPIANVQLYLLDAYLQPVPIGIAGELYIGGAGVARGYLNRPELTAERFIISPFGQSAKDRLYKTGDVARYLPTGEIEFLRRADQQVKLRGFRIELDEIKTVILKQFPEVREAIVRVQEFAPGDQRLVSYLVTGPETHLVPANVRQKLVAHLPYYMIPGAFVMLEKLPLSATGKIDYAALAVLATASREAEDTYVAPTQIIHYQLLDIWEGLLETRPIGIRDNFFMLGGHSLLAARLVAHIEQVFGKKIALSTLFAGPTIEQLADILQKQEDTQSSLPLIEVQTGGSKHPFFFLHGNWKGEAFYCFRIARAMGPDQPFYAFGTRDFGNDKALPGVEAIAADYIEVLRSIQPEGPYLLGGYCNGGMMAYEMARQLSAQGQQVDMLALINPSTAEVDTFKSLSPLIKGIGALVGMNKDQQRDFFLRVRHMLRHIYKRIFTSDSRLRDFQKLIAIDPRLQGMFPPVEALHKDYISILSCVVPDYHPGYYPGKVTYFWPQEELFLKDAWHKAAQAREVEDFVLPGTALTVIAEHIDLLAEGMSASLGRALVDQSTYQQPQQTSISDEGIASEKFSTVK